MKNIGTVLPTADSIKATAVWANKQKSERNKIASDSKILGKCKPVRAFGEVRYYLNASCYAVVGHDLRVKWFAIREDGDYAISSPL